MGTDRLLDSEQFGLRESKICSPKLTPRHREESSTKRSLAFLRSHRTPCWARDGLAPQLSSSLTLLAFANHFHRLPLTHPSSSPPCYFSLPHAIQVSSYFDPRVVGSCFGTKEYKKQSAAPLTDFRFPTPAYHGVGFLRTFFRIDYAFLRSATGEHQRVSVAETD